MHRKYCDGFGTKKSKKELGKSWTCPKCKKHIHSKRDRHVEICDGLGAGAHKRKSGPGQAWSKGKTLEEIHGLEKAKEIKARIGIVTDSKKRAWSSPEFKEKLSLSAKRQGLGGPTKRGGRGKHGRYKGIWCDSSWELAWVIFHLDHGIPFERNSKGFDYEHNGKMRKYYPDFVFSDGQYVEIKGWLTEEFKSKMIFFPHPLKVVMYEDIKNILDYVHKSYGKNFVKLYQKLDTPYDVLV